MGRKEDRWPFLIERMKKRVPGKKPAVCNSFAELIDLYPTTASLCGLDVPARIQGKDISPMLDDPKHEVRDAAFSVSGSRRGLLLRDDALGMTNRVAQGERRAERLAAQHDARGAECFACALEFADDRVNRVARVRFRAGRAAVAPEVEQHRPHQALERRQVPRPLAIARQHAVDEKHARSVARVDDAVGQSKIRGALRGH